MKKILITGGSKGIGKQIVYDLVRKGNFVVFTYNNSKESAEQIVTELKNEGYDHVEASKCDMGDEKQVKELFKRHKNILGDIDVLINNAGIRDSKVNGSPKPFLLTPSSEWWNVMYNNINGVINTCRNAIPVMIKKKCGRIINITSLAGIKGNPGQSAYASSKAAITCLSKSLSKEVSPFGININCIAPGFVETEMVENLSGNYKKARVGNSLLKRMGRVEEISNMVSYLAFEAPQFFINQELIVDGGIG